MLVVIQGATTEWSGGLKAFIAGNANTL